MASTTRPLVALLITLGTRTLSRPSYGQDQITNGGFETDNFTGWTLANQLNLRHLRRTLR